MPTGTAFFDTSATTSLSIGTATVGGWTFNAGASNYDFTNSGIFEFSGAGIAVNGGSATITNNNGLNFYNTSRRAAPGSRTTASWSSATPAAPPAPRSRTIISGNSSTAAAPAAARSRTTVFCCSPAAAAPTAPRSQTLLALSCSSTKPAGQARRRSRTAISWSSAAPAAPTAPRSRTTTCWSSSHGRQRAITNGNTFGSASSSAGGDHHEQRHAGFLDTSTAGSAAITNGASGNTDFSFSTGPDGDSKLSAGSIGGGGTFNLGANELTVGGNNLSTNVTGVIADGGGLAAAPAPD